MPITADASTGKIGLEDESEATWRNFGEIRSVDLSDDDTVISKGSLDPVYEAKARVLNRAVSLTYFKRAARFTCLARGYI